MRNLLFDLTACFATSPVIGSRPGGRDQAARRIEQATGFGQIRPDGFITAIERIRAGQKLGYRTAAQHNLAHARFEKAAAEGFNRLHPGSKLEMTKLARDYSPAAIERLHSIAHNPAAPFRDQVAAANALLDRGLGRPAMPVFHGSSGGMSSMDLGEGVPMSALVSAARRGDEGYENELRRWPIWNL